MTLAETVIGMVVFSIMAGGIIGLVLQSRRMAESAIRENTAVTVTQGYLEQIKSIEYSALVDAIADPSNVAIGTKTDQDTNDPIMLNVRNQKTLVIHTTDAGAPTRFMRFWITPRATNLAASGRRALTFTTVFEWEGNERQMGEISTSTIRFVRSYVPTY
jgi:Tfp pilus assembly protein PilV